MKIADQIAAEFGNDGTKWHSKKGKDLLMMCQFYGTKEPHGAITAWRFPDDSAIIVTDEWWSTEEEFNHADNH